MLVATGRSGGRRLLHLVKAIPAQGVYKQAHHNFFSPAFLKEGRRLLQPPSSSWLSSPFFKHHGALSHSTLQDDDLAFQEDQDKVDPFSLVADEMANLAKRLRECVNADVKKLASASEYYFKLGVEGKRFRPMVLFLMASSLSLLPSPTPSDVIFGDDRRVRQERVAEIIELIHVATLLHDDVIDHSDSRRGISSLNFIMGNKLAVLAGDFLLARASVANATLRNFEVMGLVSETLEDLVSGEVMQLTGDTQQSCSMDYYLQKTYFKTASLIANSCKCIALLADQPREVATHAFEYGRHLGLVYQLVDDALDFTGSKTTLGKPALSDLREGIATAPIIFALQEEPEMVNLIDRKFGQMGDDRLAVELVKKTKGIAKTLELAAKHAQLAEDAIARFPPCNDVRSQQCRRALLDLAQSVLKRSK